MDNRLRTTLGHHKSLILLFSLTILLPALLLGIFGLRNLGNDAYRLQRLLREEHEITFDKNGTYKMTMQCANPGDCPSSFEIHLTPLSVDCPTVDWTEARMSIRIDNVESVDMGKVSRTG